MIPSREMTLRDRRYVVNTWGHSSSYPGMTRRMRFDLVDRILDRGARCVVLATDERTVHAWACGEGNILHYVYVPDELRNKGCARRVITELLGEYADRINTTHMWPGKAHARFCFTPHLLMKDAA